MVHLDAQLTRLSSRVHLSFRFDLGLPLVEKKSRSSQLENNVNEYQIQNHFGPKSKDRSPLDKLCFPLEELRLLQ